MSVIGVGKEIGVSPKEIGGRSRKDVDSMGEYDS
jgi:hypothetical protein